MDAALAQFRDRIRAARAERKPLRLRGAGTKDFYGEQLAGEVLDIDGVTGGFNFQAAWTTGRIAGEAVAAETK